MSTSLRVGILAGEMSGDLLGAGLMKELRSRYPEVSFEGIGGDLMQAQGLSSRVPMDRLSVMGLVEPLKRLPELLRIRRELFEHFRQNPPDVFIGIDSPDFCLDLEKKLRACGIPTVHYVSPSVWAWRRRRIRKIARAVDLMLTLFPFEADFYHQHQVPVCCVGHPLADEIPEQVDSMAARQELGLETERPVLALLPGSRHGEVERLCRPFLETANLCQERGESWQFVIPAANPKRAEQLSTILEDFPTLKVTVIDGKARTVMAAADQILIASGTATLEALLLKKPMVVCYRMAPLSYAIISRLLKVENFSLPNLLAGRVLVPELVQEEVEAENLYQHLKQQRELQQPEIRDSFARIHQDLRRNASAEAARAVLKLIGR